MTEKEKTASMTESGVCAEQGDFYNGKVSENVEKNGFYIQKKYDI